VSVLVPVRYRSASNPVILSQNHLENESPRSQTAGGLFHLKASKWLALSEKRKQNAGSFHGRGASFLTPGELF
jgi:hypothetical protein